MGLTFSDVIQFSPCRIQYHRNVCDKRTSYQFFFLFFFCCMGGRVVAIGNHTHYIHISCIFRERQRKKMFNFDNDWNRCKRYSRNRGTFLYMVNAQCALNLTLYNLERVCKVHLPQLNTDQLFIQILYFFCWCDRRVQIIFLYEMLWKWFLFTLWII